MGKKLIKEFDDRAAWLRKGVVCHRGKHGGNIKENTIESIVKAMDEDLAVEIDVRLSKDKEVVLSHDDSLKRVFNIDKKISDLNYNDIKDMTGGKVPLLEDVLNIVDDKIGLMIEIKSSKVGLLEEKVYDLLKDYKGRYVIVCFNPFTLRYFKKKDPLIIRGQLSYNYNDSKYNSVLKFLLRNMWMNIFSKPHFLSYGIDSENTNLLAKYRKKGYFIIGWTYKDEKDREKLSKIYDNMIIEELQIKEF